jgi:hypothetical protein
VQVARAHRLSGGVAKTRKVLVWPTKWGEGAPVDLDYMGEAQRADEAGGRTGAGALIIGDRDVGDAYGPICFNEETSFPDEAVALVGL